MSTLINRIIAALAAFVQMLCLSLPVSYKADEVFPDPVKYAAPSEAYATRDEAVENGGGWYVTMDEDFSYKTKQELEENWNYSLHSNRRQEWWCPQAVSVNGNQAVVGAWLDSGDISENCPGNSGAGSIDGKCACNTEFFHDAKYGWKEGGSMEVVTGGINSKLEQAYGYYEARVQVPRENGMWSAFWLQTGSQGQIGNNGRDGTEIDIFESVFINADLPNYIAHAFIWDGYSTYGKTHGQKIDTGVDTYEGWHTYGLLWTPEYYVLYFDGKPTWKTVGGGVSQVPAHMRFTNEVRNEGCQISAWGTPMKVFTATKDKPAEFKIDYVKVYQNTAFEKHIKSASDFTDAGKLIPDFLGLK